MVKTGHIQCVNDCSTSGELFFNTVWVWPSLGILLALAWFAFQMFRKRNASLG